MIMVKDFNTNSVLFDKIIKSINKIVTQNKLIIFVNLIRDEEMNKKHINTEGKMDILSNKFEDFLNENKLLKIIIRNLESKISILEVKPSNIIKSIPEDIFSYIFTFNQLTKNRNLVFFLMYLRIFHILIMIICSLFLKHFVKLALKLFLKIYCA